MEVMKEEFLLHSRGSMKKLRQCGGGRETVESETQIAPRLKTRRFGWNIRISGFVF